MRMWVLLFGPAAGMPPVTHTDALFAEKSQSILDDLAASGVGLCGPVAVICAGHIGINMLAHFALQFAMRRMHGLEIIRRQRGRRACRAASPPGHRGRSGR